MLSSKVAALAKEVDTEQDLCFALNYSTRDIGEIINDAKLRVERFQSTLDEIKSNKDALSNPQIIGLIESIQEVVNNVSGIYYEKEAQFCRSKKSLELWSNLQKEEGMLQKTVDANEIESAMARIQKFKDKVKEIRHDENKYHKNFPDEDLKKVIGHCDKKITKLENAYLTLKSKITSQQTQSPMSPSSNTSPTVGKK